MTVKRMINSYRSFKDGTLSDWQMGDGLDKCTQCGYYIVRISHRDVAAQGLPFVPADEGHYLVGHLFVSETGCDDKLQRGRGVAQTLLLNDCNNLRADVYCRSGACANGECFWDEWTRLVGNSDLNDVKSELEDKLQQCVDVGQVASLDGLVASGMYTGTFSNGDALLETFVLFVIDNFAAAGATSNVRSVSQFKYALNVDGTFSHKTRTGQGAKSIAWGNWVDLGAASTADIQDNSITAQKLSIDVREKVEKIPSLELKLIKLAGFGTLYGGSTGVTGDGQYFVSTYDKKLYISSKYSSPTSFTATEVPFIDGAIYTYNNELYVYNGTEVVKSNALLEKKVDNLFTDYAAITNGIPSMDTIAKTFTIPQGAYISAAGKGYVSLSNEIIVEQVGSDWSTQYIVFHLTNKTARAVYSNSALALDDKEVVIALVRWAQGVMNGNFFSYFLNGKNVELKSLTPVRNLNSFFSDYAVLTNGTPILDTVAKTFTLPTGLYISSFALKKGFRLSNDITVEADYSSGWYTHYIVLDTVALTMRIAPSNADLNLSDTEIVVVLLRWGADTGILQGNLYSYIKNGVEIEFTPTTSLQQLKEDIGQEVVNSMTAAPMMYNPPINLLKENLRILDIGNSYTTDATHYLSDIATAAGATTGYSLYKATRSGGSFKNWVDTYNDADTDKNYLQLVAGDEMDDVVTGTGNVGDGSYFRNALLNGKWDLILIHQASNYATDFDSWNGKTNAGYLKELIQIIRQTNPQATIGFYLVHSYRSSYSGNTEKSSLERWRNIAAATKKMCLNYGIDFVIPYGTAVQNLRETSLNDENEFSTDGTHLADGLGDYVAACCYWQSMFAPRFGSIVGNGFRKTDLDENTKGVKNITDETAPIAQEAAMWAAYNWYEVVNPE